MIIETSMFKNPMDAINLTLHNTFHTMKLYPITDGYLVLMGQLCNFLKQALLPSFDTVVLELGQVNHHFLIIAISSSSGTLS